jgi:type IX secretion system PorP/SprF family membrane protein
MIKALNMKRIIFIAMLACFTWNASAQQDILLSQYMFNHMLVNPAYAGSKDYMMATLLYRKQWVGFDGAPETQVASIHGPIGLSRLGWGVTLAHDKIGITDRSDAHLNLSYQLPVSSKLKLGMGLKFGAAYFVSKFSDLKYWDANDPIYQNGRETNLLPNLGAGMMLYSDRFYAGVSIPSVISYDSTRALSVDVANRVPNQVSHLFATVGYAFPISPDVVMKPSVLCKYTKNAPAEFDFNLNFLFAEKLWVGGSYRTGDAFVGIIEFQLNKNWRLGYSYDFTTSDVRSYSSGSHEIMLGYDFGFDITKIKTPRYF